MDAEKRIIQGRGLAGSHCLARSDPHTGCGDGQCGSQSPNHPRYHGDTSGQIDHRKANHGTMAKTHTAMIAVVRLCASLFPFAQNADNEFSARPLNLANAWPARCVCKK